MLAGALAFFMYPTWGLPGLFVVLFFMGLLATLSMAAHGPDLVPFLRVMPRDVTLLKS